MEMLEEEIQMFGFPSFGSVNILGIQQNVSAKNFKFFIFGFILNNVNCVSHGDLRVRDDCAWEDCMIFFAFLIQTANSENSKFCFLIRRTILHLTKIVSKDTHTDTFAVRTW